MRTENFPFDDVHSSCIGTIEANSRAYGTVYALPLDVLPLAAEKMNDGLVQSEWKGGEEAGWIV